MLKSAIGVDIGTRTTAIIAITSDSVLDAWILMSKAKDVETRRVEFRAQLDRVVPLLTKVDCIFIEQPMSPRGQSVQTVRALQTWKVMLEERVIREQRAAPVLDIAVHEWHGLVRAETTTREKGDCTVFVPAKKQAAGSTTYKRAKTDMKKLARIGAARAMEQYPGNLGVGVMMGTQERTMFVSATSFPQDLTDAWWIARFGLFHARPIAVGLKL